MNVEDAGHGYYTDATRTRKEGARIGENLERDDTSANRACATPLPQRTDSYSRSTPVLLGSCSSPTRVLLGSYSRPTLEKPKNTGEFAMFWIARVFLPREQPCRNTENANYHLLTLK